MKQAKCDEIANAIRSAFISPNVLDSNWEAANLVDTMQRCANNLGAIAGSISRSDDQKQELSLSESVSLVATGLSSIANAISELASAIRKA